MKRDIIDPAKRGFPERARDATEHRVGVAHEVRGGISSERRPKGPRTSERKRNPSLKVSIISRILTPSPHNAIIVT